MVSDRGDIYLVLILISSVLAPVVSGTAKSSLSQCWVGQTHVYVGQTIDASNYSCTENNLTARFTDPVQSHSAKHYSSNCSLSRCSIYPSNNQNCRLSSTPCFDYRTANNIGYCAPGILCSLLDPCDALTGSCISSTSVCIINSCCTPRRVCLPIFLTTFCPSMDDSLTTDPAVPTTETSPILIFKNRLPNNMFYINLLDFNSQFLNISYELPVSIEFNNGTMNGTQMILAQRGPLNSVKLMTLQTIVSWLRRTVGWFSLDFNASNSFKESWMVLKKHKTWRFWFSVLMWLRVVNARLHQWLIERLYDEYSKYFTFTLNLVLISPRLDVKPPKYYKAMTQSRYFRKIVVLIYKV